ncbi:MAG: ATP-binding protein [Nitrospira sp.]
MSISNTQAAFLNQVLQDLAGPPEPGNIAFIRCIPAELIGPLVTHQNFRIQGWQVLAVAGEGDTTQQTITADKAVEIRESKLAATLLIVDVTAAGAGMDGIYSAAKEISEQELFKKAITTARKALPKHIADLVRETVSRAKKLGQRHAVSPWQEFTFYSQCVERPDNIGAAMAMLGLWPTRFGHEPDIRDIGKSALLVEKLLLPPSCSKSLSARITALMLQGETEAQRVSLEKVLREAGGQSLSDVLGKVAAQPSIWLNNIKPSFATDRLSRIELVSWRNRSGGITAWSGLQLSDAEDLPCLILDANDPVSGLAIRWNTHPAEISKGSVNYEVEIIATSDVLATKTIEHSERAPQKTFFSFEDFEELDESAKFQAKVVVRAIDAPEVQPDESEDFIIAFGAMAVQKTYRGSGETVRCAVEGAIILESKEELVALCHKRAEYAHFRTDSKGYIIMRPNHVGRSFRIFRPPLISEIENKWEANPEAIGRWSIQVRADGTRSGELQFHPVERGNCPESTWSRLETASRLFCEDTMQGPGALSQIYIHDDNTSARAVEYLNAWEGALEESTAALALAHTVEVQDVAGKTIGLIVLPSHPVRVAWQAAYDALAIHARYEFGLPPPKVREALKALDSSHFPSMLPGLEPGGTFVFADTLGVTAVAMVLDSDREPKAAVSTIALCLGEGIPEIAPSVGHQTATVLGKEVDSYLKYHQNNRLLHLHALRPGDGGTVVRALGKVIRQPTPSNGEEEMRKIAFSLNIYPSSAQQAVAGRFLTQLSQRRRSGSGGIEKEDAWILDPLPCGGNRTMPRLRWSRRDCLSPGEHEPAHISLTFDTFDSRVVAEERSSQSSPLHVFGLVASLEREFFFEAETPVWKAFVNPEQDGEKHPTARVLTERLSRVHSATLRAVARSLSKSGGWPILRTDLNREEVETLKTLHRLSDWVVTVDRNAGIEYFDSPREAQAVYDAYVIDAVPERDDLGCLQMITSTSHLDEVRGLLDQALSFMGLSSSLRNCEFLLGELKALSGRLAMRLASATTEAHAKTSGELIALALSRAQCRDPQPGHSCWLSLNEGFFVPLDDVRDLLPTPERQGDQDERDNRADLLYVAAPTRGGIILRFVEVKYRRHLALARSLDLVETVSRQASASWNLWLDWYFPQDCSPVIRSMRRSKLARALRFYAEKAMRHHLPTEAFKRISQEINRMLQKPEDYTPSVISEPNRGYIFCPEFTQPEPERLFPDVSDDTAIFLFGPGALLDVIQTQRADVSGPMPTAQEKTAMPGATPVFAETRSHLEPTVSASTLGQQGRQVLPMASSGTAGIILGTVHGTTTPVNWSVKIEGNPHLMIVGLPGMGKTTCLVNLCRQLQTAGITPIVFSYHDDIDSKLTAFFPGFSKSDCQSLGFNPMRVTDDGPFGNIESAGLLRDIFASIFPELGDLQLETIRAAIKSSYETYGWGPRPSAVPLETPPFREFFKKLQSSSKGDTRTQTLLARLTELDDYMFFNDTLAAQSLLDESRLAVLQIHKTQNAAVQRAYASFAFYRIYQDMFRRGRQDRITHAVIFDEAHRASRLKLIPTMAKECRKYGIALVLASQEARDFDTSLFSAIANYLILRVTEHDAKTLARNVAPSDMERRVADRLKQIEKYQALYFCEGRRNPTHLDLTQTSG